MKIGLFGGTFDPIHTGHIILAETARSDLCLDRILFIPAAIPPNKMECVVTSAAIRVEMLLHAIDKIDNFDMSDTEIRRGGVSYTIDTVNDFLNSSEYEDSQFTLLLGGDSLVELDAWKDPERLLKSIPTVVMGRPGYDGMSAPKSFKEQVTFIRTPLIEISSTEIRRRVQEGKSVRFWVPDPVESYIREKGLYR